MISYNQAKSIIQQAALKRPCGAETIASQNSVGRVCAKVVLAPINNQPFDNSAMDGFAVRRKDIPLTGGQLTCSGIIIAGDKPPKTILENGQCLEIMTGAPIPLGADAVVPVEQIDRSGESISFSKRPENEVNIRRAGEDFTVNTQILSVGQRIQPQYIMPLATLGIDKVAVFKKPKVVFLATGDELASKISEPLEPGTIYNSNAPYSVSVLEFMGMECLEERTLEDDVDEFKSTLRELSELNLDFIISSGAVSAGRHDFIPQCLQEMGAEILFHKVSMAPGKPILLARLANGTLYFGLPGNPVATAVGLRFFVQPCLRAMMNMLDESPVYAKSLTSFKKRAGMNVFLKARAESWDDGVLTVDLLEGQASFMVSPFLDMNCWATTSDSSSTEIKAGELVELHSLYPNAGFL